VLAAAVALQEHEENRAEESARLSALVDRIRGTVALMEGIDVQGDPVERLPHVLTFSCLYADGEALVSRLNREGFAVGSGSACATGTLEPSRVLAAVGALTHGNVRIALHPAITEEDVERFLAVLPQVLADVRAQAGARGRPKQ
jgi:cysteine desulfurase